MIDFTRPILAKIKLHNKNNPVYSKQIEETFKITGAEVRMIIRELRRNGEPIASSKEGYYYAKDINELQETIGDLRARAFSLLNTARLLESRFITNDNQLFKTN